MSGENGNGGDQADKANAFMRGKLGVTVDEAAGAAGKPVYQAADAKGRGVSPRAAAVDVLLPGRGGRVPADFASDLGKVLATAPIYRRGDLVVTVNDETGMLDVMTPDGLITWVDDYAAIVEEVEVGKGDNKFTLKIKRGMQPSLAKITLASAGFKTRLRPLESVHEVRMPVWRADNRIELLGEGYDEAARVFTRESGVYIDEQMTLPRAVQVLGEFYDGFPWADLDVATGISRSKAVAVALAVSLFGTAMLPMEEARMGCMVRANTQGGGKSLVAQIGICASFGWPENTPRSGEDELRKVLDTAALQGSRYLFFDNLKNYLESPLLEGFMTSPVWAGRVMGSQRGFKAKKCTMLIVTGNNLTVSTDLERRLLQCDLFVREADVQDRRHARELRPTVIARPDERGKLLSALWTLIRNWDRMGRPEPGTPERPTLKASFEEWSRIFGGIVQAAGMGNPMEKPKDSKSADPKGVHQRSLVKVLAGYLTEKEPLVEYAPQAVIDAIVENEFFTWMVKGRHRKSEGSGEDEFILDSGSASTIGLMLTNEMCGREFVLPDGSRVEFSHNNKPGRGKRYQVKWVSGPML